MVDSKSIFSQVSEFLLIVNHLKDAGFELLPAFIVGVIIVRLPPSWNSYKKKLMHAETDYDLEGLQRHLRIEEDSRKREIKDSQQTENHSKKQQGQKNEVNMVEDKLVIVVQAANAVSNNESGWWYDNGSTVHICKDRHLYKTYEPVIGEGNEVVSANNLHIKVICKGTVELSFTSGKTVTLTNVLHVPDIVKNLVSGDLVMKAGFKTTYESSNFVLSKNGKFDQIMLHLKASMSSLEAFNEQLSAENNMPPVRFYDHSPIQKGETWSGNNVVSEGVGFEECIDEVIQAMTQHQQGLHQHIQKME
ncbi:uncharacterized protein LOC113359491 [Papaver somniferum]|uniref:uncharacterized protein LOC113359491 n=1 Tax=Papaver somniferum TaxID=3469 RepID=UPI000E6FA72E|nr:uncharacterized protein LOC113359491 [Papaver somniferum]